MLPATSDIVNALSWSLAHSLWQGLLAYVVLRAALFLIPGQYSAARYYTAVTALGAIVAVFVITFIYEYSPVTLINYTAGSPVATAQPAVLPIVTPQAKAGLGEAASSWYRAHTLLVVNLYLAGMVLLLSRILFNLLTLKSLRTQGTMQPDEQWVRLLEGGMYRLNIGSRVRLLFSDRITVPMVMGHLKPVILIPVAIANRLTTAEAEAILLHELAHIRRHDYLVNLIQMFIETILFYNPFVWFVSSIIRKERELCCDDIVVDHSAERLHYARALAALETYRLYPAAPSLAATGSKNHLLTRIKRIMEMKKDRICYSRLTAVLLVAVLLAGSAFLLATDVSAQSKKDKNKKKVEKKETTTRTNKHVQMHSVITASDKADDENLRQQKKVIVITDGDTVKNYSVNKTIQGTDEIVEEVFAMLDEIGIDAIVDDAMAGVQWGGGRNTLHDSMNFDISIDGAKISREAREALVKAKKELGEASEEYRAALSEARKQMAAANKEYASASAEARNAYRKQKELTLKDHGDAEIYLARTGEKVPVDAKVQVFSRHDELLEQMEKDGLINRKTGFKIEKKGDDLYIDNIKQSKEVLKKYAPMMDTKNLVIKGNYRSIAISATN